MEQPLSKDTRRNFLQKTILTAGSMGLFYPQLRVTKDLINGIITMNNEDSNTLIEGVDSYGIEGIQKPLILTNINHKDKGIHNIGIVHTHFRMKLHWDELKKEIDNADIVLLESGFDDFFGDVFNDAMKKKSIIIDPSNSILNLYGFVGLTYITFSAIQGIATDSLRSKIKLFLGTLIGGELLPLLTPLSLIKFDLGYGLEDDHSFIIDGRTIFMHSAILKIKKENPDKKILVITGDIHARMFEYYFNNSEIAEEKRLLYEKIYFGHIHIGQGNEHTKGKNGNNIKKFKHI
ncbi:hypothetical protein KBD33_00230 [Candidatus Gracilibacteria bacterium]|nr:hypothetical protein [Candidatus Gracilibacteria bacterium]